MLHTFNNSEGTSDDGCVPFASLTFDTAGNLFGTTNKGGGGGEGGTFCFNGCGTVFELSPRSDGAWSEKVIHAFPGTPGNTDGQNPYSSVAFDSHGNLWGTTQAGGTGGAACNPFGAPPGCGTVFELTPQKNGKMERGRLFTAFRTPAPAGTPIPALSSTHRTMSMAHW
ncbi:MAG: choice-of-anchor tandem repeat GloVer-containing protein [Rhizomicrobium sp.]